MHHRPHPLTHGPNAGTLRTDCGIMARDRDLAAVTSLACHSFDLNCAVRDLGNLELEELLDQSWMGSGNDDLGAAKFLAHRNHIDPDPGSVRVALSGNLLATRPDRRHLSEL